MDLLSEVQKDALQFARERRTLLLLITAPVLVLMVMGAIFGGGPAQAGKTAIGLCDLDQSSTSQLFVAGIRNSSTITDFGAGEDCAQRMDNEVRGGRLAAGLVIPKGYEQGLTEGRTQNISVILDNSKFQVSPTIEAFVKAAVQETSQRIGAQFIMSVWVRLNEADGRLEQMLVELNETRERASDMKERLQATSDSLDSLDIVSVRGELYLANLTINRTVVALDDAEANLSRIESDFTGYDDTLRQTEGDLQEINGTLANASGYIAGIRTGMNCTAAFAAQCVPLDALGGQMSGAQQSVESRLAKVRNARAGLAAANATIQEFKASILLAKNSSDDATERIGNMMGFVDDLARNRNDALSTIWEAQSSLDGMVEKTYELEGIINTSRGQLSEITSRPPDFVISPMAVDSDYLFGIRPYFGFMLPSLLPLILMFISLFLASTSLVREKHSGTLSRVYASQVNSFEFVIVKVLSYTAVLLPEAVLLALIASGLYNAFPIADLGTWFFVLQALCLLTLAFVALGVLIAIYSESEATAFLASLVVGLPLLFMSGLLFPFEFMPPLVAFFGMLSPLSLAVLSMQAAITYHSLQAVGSLTLVFYAALFALFAALSLRK